MISSTKNEEMCSGIDEKKMQWKAGAAEANQEFRYALRKFHRDCENFATIAKIWQS